MKSQIWKFGPLNPSLVWKDIPIDEFAGIVHFGEQHRNLFFWTAVFPEGRTIMRQFMVIPTGVDIPEDGLYHGTVIASDGLVWHLYERG